MCTGALTAELARGVLQKYVRSTGFDMHIETVALWDTGLQAVNYGIL